MLYQARYASYVTDDFALRYLLLAHSSLTIWASASQHFSSAASFSRSYCSTISLTTLGSTLNQTGSDRRLIKSFSIYASGSNPETDFSSIFNLQFWAIGGPKGHLFRFRTFELGKTLD